MKLIFPYPNFFNAWLYFTERNAQIVTRTEEIASLVLTTVSAENPCSQRYVVENGSRKVTASLPIIRFSFLTEVQNSPSDAVDKSCRWNWS